MIGWFCPDVVADGHRAKTVTSGFDGVHGKPAINTVPFAVTPMCQMEQIKRANKLFNNDCIFLKNSLNIPVLSEKRYIFNGLSLESPDGDGEGGACQETVTPRVMLQDIEGPSPTPSPPPEDSKPPQPQPEELSAKDFLHRLDLQIKQSKQAARRLKEEEVRWGAEQARSQATA